MSRFDNWPLDALRRHADEWERTADICTRLHYGCDCNRLYRQLAADARAKCRDAQTPQEDS